jgi:phospholipid transport system substrate-binding protein
MLLQEKWCIMPRNKTTKLLISFFCFIVMVVSLSQTTAFATPDPTEQFRPFLKKVTDALADPDLKTYPKYEQGRRMINVVRERFDFREMSKRVLGQQWRDLNESEQKDFEDLFTRMLQYAYIGKIDDYSGQKVEFTQQRIKGDRAEVQTLLVDKDKSVSVAYIMLLRGDQWMAYDVVVEGVSLIRNYMEQFKEILKKDGYAGLVRQVKEKIEQIEKEKKRN